MNFEGGGVQGETHQMDTRKGDGQPQEGCSQES